MNETSYLPKRTHIVYLGLALYYLLYSMPFPFHNSHIKHARPQLVYKQYIYETKHAFATSAYHVQV